MIPSIERVRSIRFLDTFLEGDTQEGGKTILEAKKKKCNTHTHVKKSRHCWGGEEIQTSQTSLVKGGWRKINSTVCVLVFYFTPPSVSY